LQKSIYSERYTRFRQRLIEARKAASFSQAELAKRLEKHQSFVAKYEIGERRIDVAEFLEIVGILGVDPCDFFKDLTE
jgi:transcriptional regulator with XRE-family HTH domain